VKASKMLACIMGEPYNGRIPARSSPGWVSSTRVFPRSQDLNIRVARRPNLLSLSFPAGAGPDPTHDLPKGIRPECNSPHHLPGEGFNLRFALAPFLRQSHPLTNDLAALLVFRFHARSLMLCAINFACPPAVAVEWARSASGEKRLSGEGQFASAINTAIAVIFVQKARDLPAKRCGVKEVTHRGSIVKEFPLQLSG
jgi:hypothetical protein